MDQEAFFSALDRAITEVAQQEFEELRNDAVRRGASDQDIADKV